MSRPTAYLETAELLEETSDAASASRVPAAPTSTVNQRAKQPRPRHRFKPFNYRQLFWKWHLYAGLCGSPLLILIALTGAILIFAPEIDHALRPDLWHIQPSPGAAPESAAIFDQPLIDTVRSRFPKSKLNSYRQNDHPDEPYQFLLLTPGVRGIHDVWVNQYTRQIVGERFREFSLVRIAEQLHRRLLTGEIGSSVIEFITGWCIVLTLTGLYLWWPKSWRQLYNGIVPTFRGSAYKVNWRLHNTVGAWTAVVVLLLAVSGMVFSTFTGGMFIRLIGLTGGPKKARLSATQKPAERTTSVSIDDLLRKVRADSPAGVRFNVQLPRDSEGTIVISTLRPERPTWADRKNYGIWTFDQFSGALVKHYAWNDQHPLLKFRQLCLVIHFGSIFGLPTKIVALAACLAIPLMAVTGFLIWWWKRLVKAALATRRTAAPSSASPVPAAPVSRWVVAALLCLCLIFPTIGVSFLVVIAFEALREWWRSHRSAQFSA
jgi:uncharacterized iron-regulated membrane protein